MFLKQAWNKREKSSTGMVGFDNASEIGIGNVEGEFQLSIFIGTSISTVSPRETILENLIDDDLLSLEWSELVYDYPDSEFNFHQFSYPSKSGVRKMYKCLIKVDSSGVEVMAEQNFVRSTLGFSKSKRVIGSLRQTLLNLHNECREVEVLAREVAKDKSLRSLVSNKVKSFGQEGYFGMKEMSGCLDIARRSGWNLTKVLETHVAEARR